jgi:hypothetical protein
MALLRRGGVYVAGAGGRVLRLDQQAVGVRIHLAQVGASGGRVKSDQKAAAARRNGRQGGRRPGAGAYTFGLGEGKISGRERARIDKIAEKHGATFVTHRGPECRCGRGCIGGCHGRYWFVGPNTGQPFDGNLARALLAEVGVIRTMRR